MPRAPAAAHPGSSTSTATCDGLLPPGGEGRRRALAAGACAAAGGLVSAMLPSAAYAQAAFPNKPIRLVVPFAAGGVSDIVGRALGQKMGELFGQPVVIENRAGAGGAVGSEFVANAAADGYTLLLSSVSTIAIGPFLVKKLGYDPVNGLTPIGIVTYAPNVLAIHAGLPFKSLAELLAFAKANPGKLSYGSAGVGSIGHLSGELLRSVTGSDMVHVPYKTSAAAYPDVIGGNVSMVFDTLPAAINHIKAGKVRALAVLSPRRAALMPEVPTFAEAGVPEATLNFWSGLHAPANLSPALVARLSETLNKALNAPDLKERLLQLGADAFPVSQPAFVAQIKDDVARIAKVVKAAGIQPE
ncbi:MAG: tripartite tricarboxylate transporter substrate binding protein [Rhodocyclaceae bacterium]|nr:tripartite tricarboxylate transporter substrate binding protein [Rhodocyclaceae bacterium]MCA4901735.1 tripartite tricarboxylate transporter substrate binding protein [Rhodocyclaceae bacterium]